MGKVKNQMDIAAEAFDILALRVERSTSDHLVLDALNELRVELIELGLDIQR